ncbi:MAG: hypothetical protein HOD43_10705 [Candidatus Marinimicrobia bacterium]|jgi:hypothetical protein|nr:hypothetical protein [Candidatus Neomarinimicrobiota bacterium]MBT3630974.1 hypothetical protein [Candidatus Neomarinimicrobiota bacterium]MBT3823932.1 hypothetical protein [Candidatus Neomarinimicrobiota bacterium]MBT4130798.1 hypothetical protein [Candidatus Neomarinimicrobiota bacterium]MBT4296263.1 hypothetical protein [Candidatus Neomarinimicrobiota bacterium]
MNQEIYQLILMGMMMLSPSEVDAKNLSILSHSRLDNYELLDVYIQGVLAFIPGGLGGLNIVDIADPLNPTVISSYHAGGCDWGRIYSWTASGDYAYGTGRECGVHVINISDLSDPTFATIYSDESQSDQRYEHAETDGATLYLSKHQLGIELVDISQAPFLSALSNISTHNAWASLVADSTLYIADGSAGIKIVSVRDLLNPELLGSLATSGTAKDVALVGHYLFVAVGAAGVDMIDISDLQNPLFVNNYNTSGYASRVSANASRIAVSDWDDVEILTYDDQGMTLAGYKDTGGRVMAIEMIGDIIFSAEWEDFVVFNYGEIQGPDIDLSTRKIEFPRVHAHGALTRYLTINNNGHTPLEIIEAALDISDFEIELGDNMVAPDSSVSIPIVYRPGTGSWAEGLTLTTNDPDELGIEITLTGNYPSGPMVGDMAPEFELEVVNGLGTISTQELFGQPVVLAFFTAW